MTVYLVDFENVRSEGLRGVEELGEGDKVVIFYSKNADAITFDVHRLLSKSRAEIETFRILRGGRNSLDFQLSTYLGYLVMENCYSNIVIVSQDKGFLCATSFWEENGELCNANIKLCKSISSSDMESSSKDEFEDGLTGKFIEKIDVRKTNFSSGITNNEQRMAAKEAEARENELTSRETASNTSNVSGEKTAYTKPPYTKAPYAKTSYTRPAYTKAPYDNSSYEKAPYAKTSYVKPPYVKPPYVKPSYEKPSYEKAVYTRPVETETAVKPENKVVAAPKNSVKNTEPKVNLNIQNPTSKNKIFAAEIKLNVTEDLREIISGKYDEKVVPVLVETLGLSTGKQHFYRMLVSRLGQEQGHNIYMLIKGQYANLKRK